MVRGLERYRRSDRAELSSVAMRREEGHVQHLPALALRHDQRLETFSYQ